MKCGTDVLAFGNRRSGFIVSNLFDHDAEIVGMLLLGCFHLFEYEGGKEMALCIEKTHLIARQVSPLNVGGNETSKCPRDSGCGTRLTHLHVRHLKVILGEV